MILVYSDNSSVQSHAHPPLSDWPTLIHPLSRDGRIVTGHQAWHYHPGILAKYIALSAIHQQQHAVADDASNNQNRPLNIVVAHDTYEPLTIQLPVNQGGVLSTYRLELGQQANDVPVCFQHPIDASDAVQKLIEIRATVGGEIPVETDRIIEAWQAAATHQKQVGTFANLADQVAWVMQEMMQPITGPYENQSTLTLLKQWGQSFLRDLLDDTHTSIHCLNQATAKYPQAGMRPLHLGTNLVELPLWHLAERQRLPVYAITDGQQTLELTSRVGTIDLDHALEHQTLVPRAVTLTAVMRSTIASLFIHGTGGGIYDAITEHWFQLWQNKTLQSKAVISADLYLPLDVMTAEAAHLTRSIWYQHHLPHNLDRELKVDSDAIRELAERKQHLLEHMHDDRNPKRRKAAFKEIHAINDALAKQHPKAKHKLKEAKDRVWANQVGVRNLGIKTKRDWPFAIYKETALQDLAQSIRTGFKG